MSNTPDSPTQTVTPEFSSIFVAFRFSGTENGLPKEGWDSRVIKVPAEVKLGSSEDIKAVADAIASSEFNNGKRYVGLEITPINFVRLPV